jgi:hypothetical protein
MVTVEKEYAMKHQELQPVIFESEQEKEERRQRQFAILTASYKANFVNDPADKEVKPCLN